jgi:DNA-binding transcriptional MerR regulator
MAEPPQRMTIDDLAHRSGTATSTIRLYQTKGVLPPPQKEGRVGYYGPGHLARLRLIAQLQDEGFSLASIGRLVDAWENGRGLDTVLGLETQIAATWADEEPLYLRPDEVATHFPDGALAPDLVQRTLALGLLGVDGDRLVVSSPRFLEIGAELARLGIPLDEVIDEYERLQEVTAGVAEQFTQLFERHLWGPFVERGLPAEDVRELTEVLQRLNSLAEGVLTITLRRSLKRAATAFLAAQAEQLQEAGVLDAVRPLAEAAGLDLESG